MKGADIVQVSASKNALVDRVGIGFTVPSSKGTPVAHLVSSSITNGYAKVTFTRPFDSPSGTPIAVVL